MSAANSEQIVLALGSNLGEPLNNLRWGALRLQAAFKQRCRLSRPWLTTPVDCPPDSPPFANAIALFESSASFSPASLLLLCQEIEQACGRTPKKVHNEARPLDVDIVSFQGLRMNTETLELPHPRALARFFVLAPLNELCPSLVLPGQQQTIFHHFKHCQADPHARPVDGFDWHERNSDPFA